MNAGSAQRLNYELVRYYRPNVDRMASYVKVISGLFAIVFVVGGFYLLERNYVSMVQNYDNKHASAAKYDRAVIVPVYYTPEVFSETQLNETQSTASDVPRLSASAKVDRPVMHIVQTPTNLNQPDEIKRKRYISYKDVVSKAVFDAVSTIVQNNSKMKLGDVVIIIQVAEDGVLTVADISGIEDVIFANKLYSGLQMQKILKPKKEEAGLYKVHLTDTG